MKTRSLSITAGALLLIALLLTWFQWWPGDHPSEPSTVHSTVPKSPTSDRNTPRSTSMRSDNNTPQTEPPSATGKEDILTAIHDASVTYDPAQLPKIAAFLQHDDAQIRQAAIDGMIVLGDSAAAPLLREAAKTAFTPKEAVALEEAAAYMELPSARNVLRGKKKNAPDPTPRLSPP